MNEEALKELKAQQSIREQLEYFENTARLSPVSHH